MRSLTSAVPWERVKAERASQGDGGCRDGCSQGCHDGRLGKARLWPGATAMGSSARALGLPSISPPGWEPLRLGKCLGKVTPSSRAADEVRRASSGLAVSCELQQRNCKESSAAGSRGLVSEREKQGLAHPYLTFVWKAFHSSSC